MSIYLFIYLYIIKPYRDNRTKDTHTQSVFKVAHPCLEIIFIN